MQEIIDRIKEEYQSITDALLSPEVSSDRQKMTDLGKKQAALEEIIEKIRLYEKLQKDMRDNADIINTEEDPDIKQIAMEDNMKLVREEEKVKRDLEIMLLPKDPHDTKNVIVEIRAGAGGDESALFAQDLHRMYLRFAQLQNWHVHMLTAHRTGVGGFKEVIFELNAPKNAEPGYKLMKYESGVPRVQRIPETEKSGRIHTPTATVAVLPAVEDVEFVIDAKDLRIDTFASSGPGGQSVNTTMSAVRITHLPTGTVVSCQDEKSQHKNKDKAMKVLRSRLLQMEEEKRAKEQGDKRKSQVGTGDRSEKIRTYNFPQDRVTDHRIKKSWGNLQGILDGNVGKIIAALQEEETRLSLENHKEQ